MKVVIIRHGEPDNPNNTLTKHGFKEVEALSEYLKDFKFDDVYVSPLPRAQLTAKGVLDPLNIKFTTIPWLQEFDHRVNVPYTDKKVINWDFLPKFFTEQDDFYDETKYLDHNVLKTGDVKKYYYEVSKGIDEILAKHGYHRKDKYYEVTNENKDNIVFFCHFGTMCVIMSHLLNIPYVVLAQTFVCLPTGITTLVTEEREKGIAQFRCMQFGNLTHLENKKIEPSFHARFCETYSSFDEKH